MGQTLQFRHLGGQYAFGVEATNEFKCLETWLTTQLGTLGLPGGVHQGLAPEASAYPFASFHFHQAAPDTRSGRSGRLANLVYVVEVVAQGEVYDTIDAYAAALVSLLDVSNQAVGSGATTGTIVRGQRVSPWKEDEVFEQP